jgi:hypothetical protein
LTSASPQDLLFPEEIMSQIEKRNVKSALEVSQGSADIAWFLVTESDEKKTKNGKTFMRLKIVDKDSKTGMLRVWGCKQPIEPYTMWLAEVKHDNWGYSATGWKMKQIESAG